MKPRLNLLAVAMLACALCLPAFAQTTNAPATTNAPSWISGPITDVIDFVSTGSNYIVVPYGIYDAGSEEWGAGIGIGYKLNDFVIPTMRMDWLSDDIFLVNGSVQLQFPFQLFNKFRVTPFAFAGGGTVLTGTDDEGELMGIFGSGLAISITEHFFLIGDWESWGGFNDYQYRFGGGWKF